MRLLLVLTLACVWLQSPRTEQTERNRGDEKVREQIHRLRTADLAGKLEACAVLGAMQSEARPAVPVLLKTLQEAQRPELRMVVITCLGNIGDAGAVPAILEALQRDKDEDVRGMAARVLGRFPTATKTAVSVLVPLLTKEGATGEGAIAGLIAVGRPAVPALSEVFKSGDKNARLQAAHVLWGIGNSDAAGAVPVLVSGLEDRDSDIRRAAAETLGGIGPGAQSSVPALSRRIKDEDPFVRLCAALSLYYIERNDRQVVPTLVEGLSHQNPRVRSTAASDLFRLGRRAAPAVPTLIKTLQDADPDVRWQAILVLGMLGAEAQPAVPALKRLQASETDPDLAARIREALRDIAGGD